VVKVVIGRRGLSKMEMARVEHVWLTTQQQGLNYSKGLRGLSPT